MLVQIWLPRVPATAGVVLTAWLPLCWQEVLEQQSEEDRQHTEQLLGSLSSEVSSKLQALGVGLSEQLRHLAASQEELLQGQQGLAQGQEEVLRGQDQLRQAQAAAQEQAQQAAEEILGGQQGLQQDVRAAHNDLRKGQQDIKDHVSDQFKGMQEHVKEFIRETMSGQAGSSSAGSGAAQQGQAAGTAGGEAPPGAERSSSLPTRVGGPADVWLMTGAQLIKAADRDNNGTVIAAELSSMLGSYGLVVDQSLAKRLLLAHGRLMRRVQADMLKKLLQACWEAVQAGAAGDASEGSGHEEAGRWLSKEQCRSVMLRLAGADGVEEVLGDVEDDEQVDFALLVSLVVQAKHHT